MTASSHITVRVPLRIRCRPGRKTVVTPVVDGIPAPATTRADPALLKAVARAFRYQRMLDDGRYASISEMAAAEKLDRGYLGRLLQLTLLAPDIVEAIVEGRQSEDVTLPWLMESFPEDWEGQRAHVVPCLSPSPASSPGAHGGILPSRTACGQYQLGRLLEGSHQPV